MIIYVDIDGTIAETDGSDYESAKPLFDKIKKINTLFEAGHIIVYWTARGTKTGIDWSSLTKEQLDSWGAHYASIKMGKPDYDLMICDKVINIKDL